VRSEAKHGVPGGGDQRYLYRSGINPRDCAFKGLVSNPAWLESYEGSRKVVSPTSKGLTRSSRLGPPFHEHPEQIAIAKGPGGQKISLAEKTVNAISAPTSMAICQTNTPSTPICLSIAIVVRLFSEDCFAYKPPISQQQPSGAGLVVTLIQTRSLRSINHEAIVCTENLSSGVAVVKSAQYGARTDHARPLNRARNRRIFVQGSMRSEAISRRRISGFGANASRPGQ
jgi:hypothetical protein